MIKDMESLVNKCLIQHEGGTVFFDAIDERLRNDKILMSMMLSKVLDKERFDYIIVSGKFGRVFKKFCSKHINKEISEIIIVVNGGLRKGNKIKDFYNQYEINNKKLVFIDDSYYLGRTRDSIKSAIDENGGKLMYSYVFYDGSKVKDDTVHSFYRYFDNYPITEE
jgi:hypothetical protein